MKPMSEEVGLQLPQIVLMLHNWGQTANSSGLSRWPKEVANWQPPSMVAWATTMPSLSAPIHPHPIHDLYMQEQIVSLDQSLAP
jgi:hypothetical protein